MGTLVIIMAAGYILSGILYCHAAIENVRSSWHSREVGFRILFFIVLVFCITLGPTVFPAVTVYMIKKGKV